jgi:hypothetical protein
MKAVEKVEAHIADALEKGAKVVPDGKRTAPGGSGEMSGSRAWPLELTHIQLFLVTLSRTLQEPD